MSLKHIIESWRDAEYRESLDDETRSLLPENPVGEIELSEAELSGIDGGTSYTLPLTVTVDLTYTATVTVKSPMEGK